MISYYWFYLITYLVFSLQSYKKLADYKVCLTDF